MDQDNEFFDLPVDPKEALSVLHVRYRQRISSAQAANQDPEELMRELIDIAQIFDEIHSIGLVDSFTTPPLDWPSFKKYFERSERILTRNRIEAQMIAAKERNEIATDLVRLGIEAKHEIHALIDRIRDQLYKIDLEEPRRTSLFDKLNTFAKEVDRNITRTEGLTKLALDLAKTANEIHKNVSPIQDTIDRIFSWINSTKDVALPRPDKPLQISGPQVTIRLLPTSITPRKYRSECCVLSRIIGF